MNDFESYDDFCEFINDFAPYRCTERFNIPELVFRSLGICENTYAFICHLPPNIEWNEHIYHQAHVTWNQLSGGLTGTGSGSKVVFCCKSKVHETILNLPPSSIINHYSFRFPLVGCGLKKRCMDDV